MVDPDIVVVAAVAIVLESVVAVSCSADVLSDVVADSLTGALSGFVPGDGVNVLADVSANIFAAMMTDLDLALPTPLEELDC